MLYATREKYFINGFLFSFKWISYIGRYRVATSKYGCHLQIGTGFPVLSSDEIAEHAPYRWKKFIVIYACIISQQSHMKAYRKVSYKIIKSQSVVITAS